MFAEAFGYVLNLFRVVPHLVEKRQVGAGERRLFDSVDEVGDGVAGLVPKVNGRKAVKRLIDGPLRLHLKANELLHRSFTAI